jgi:demethylmenaquinone methyltransferase/2-methoxy-6-polyprenyl-1,4-benzoquinol methylase
VLEFPLPPEGPFGRLFRFYFLYILPRLGGLISRRRGAYSYLPDSVLKFPPPAELARHLEGAGFDGVRYTLQTFGVSALHTGEKPTRPSTIERTSPGRRLDHAQL